MDSPTGPPVTSDLDPHQAGRGRPATILIASFALLLVVAFGWLTSGRAVTQWDAGIVARLAGERTAWLTGRMIGLSMLGGWMAIPIALAVTLLLARLGQGRAAACYSVTALSGWALNAILK